MTKIGPVTAKCNICGHEFRFDKGTSNMARHLKSKHTTPVDDHVQVSGQIGSSTSGTKTSQQFLTQPTIASSLNRVIKYKPDSDKKIALDHKLLNMICKDMQPFSIVDDTGFQEFCQEMDNRYDLPSRRQLKRSLHTVYNQEKDSLIETFLQVDFVAITTDSWSSVNMESFLTITAHFLEPLPSWKLQSLVLATRMLDKGQQGGSAEGMADLITEVLDEYCIKDKLVSATTDNASAMVSLVKNYLKVLHVRCFAHTLNLIVKDSIKATTELCTLVEAVKKIVNFFHKSAKATAKLKSTIADSGLTHHKLCQDVDTRWNSTLKMLRRYRELHRAVSGALVALGKTELIISDQNVEKMDTFCECLEPFEEATEMMSTERTTSLSKIIVVVKQLQLYLGSEATKCQLTEELVKRISNRFPDVEGNFSEAVATLLDPRFKRVPFSDETKRTQHEMKIIDMMTSLFTPTNNANHAESAVPEVDADAARPVAKRQKSFMHSFMEKIKKIEETTPETLTGPKAEFERYIGMKFLDIREDPLKWWLEHSPLFPHLSLIARKYMFIPATSVPSERLFSKAGELVSKKRNCLKESTVDMILFLNKLKK